ncbi:hypothetical protein Tco_1423898, partial [Tanacetum coccineum]
VPRVLVTCRSRSGRQMELLGDETDIVPLYYHIVDNIQIQFGREEFYLVTGLRVGVDYSADYKNEDDPIPFRLANDRDGWDKYPWGSYIWPTVYSQLRDTNARRWPNLYAAEPRRDVNKKTYSMFGFTWAFKTWILDSFRVGTNEYYKRHRRYPRVVAWSSNKKFY